MKTKYKYELNWWDQYDQDRWISSSFISLLTVLLVFIILRNISLPELPRKPPIIEEFVFVEEKVQKKVFPQKRMPVQEKIESVEIEEPEITVEIFQPVTEDISNLPQNFQFSDQLQIFEQESQDMPVSASEFKISDGEFADLNEEAAIDLNNGINSDWTQENVSNTVITVKHGDPTNTEISSGISTTIKMDQKTAKVHFAGFKGIAWKELLDPLLDWIGKNSVDIGTIPKLEMQATDSYIKTARKRITINGKKFEILLASNERKRQVTICMVDLQTNEYVLLIDQGLAQKSSIFKKGTLRRLPTGEIIEMRSEQLKANSKLADERMAQFWSWAKTLQ